MRHFDQIIEPKVVSLSPRIAIIIPAYNEETIIARVMEDFVKTRYIVVVVDDGSTDATPSIVSLYPVYLLRHVINLGQGAALQTGFTFVCNKNLADYAVTFDADGQHDIGDISDILAPLMNGKFDVVLGSRFLSGRKITGIGFFKFLILKAAVIFSRYSTGLQITDTHNGLRAFSINALRNIHITQNRMAHASELLSQISRNKLNYCEVPVTVHYNDYSKKKGQSIVNSLNILWDLFFGRD